MKDLPPKRVFMIKIGGRAWSALLFGIFAASGVLPVELKPSAYSTSDLLVQRLNDLEHEADKEVSIQQVFANHFARDTRWQCRKLRSCNLRLLLDVWGS